MRSHPSSIAGITAFVFGIVRGGDVGWSSPQVIGTLVLGLVLLAVFLAWEKRAPSPIFDVSLFASSAFSAAVAVIALVFLAYMGLVFFLSFYLQAARGFTPLKTGLLLLPLAAGQLSSPREARRWCRGSGRDPVTAAGLALMTVAFAYYTTAGETRRCGCSSW